MLDAYYLVLTHPYVKHTSIPLQLLVMRKLRPAPPPQLAAAEFSLQTQTTVAIWRLGQFYFFCWRSLPFRHVSSQGHCVIASAANTDVRFTQQ